MRERRPMRCRRETVLWARAWSETMPHCASSSHVSLEKQQRNVAIVEESVVVASNLAPQLQQQKIRLLVHIWSETIAKLPLGSTHAYSFRIQIASRSSRLDRRHRQSHRHRQPTLVVWPTLHELQTPCAMIRFVVSQCTNRFRPAGNASSTHQHSGLSAASADAERHWAPLWQCHERAQLLRETLPETQSQWARRHCRAPRESAPVSPPSTANEDESDTHATHETTLSKQRSKRNHTKANHKPQVAFCDSFVERQQKESVIIWHTAFDTYIQEECNRKHVETAP